MSFDPFGQPQPPQQPPQPPPGGQPPEGGQYSQPPPGSYPPGSYPPGTYPPGWQGVPPGAPQAGVGDARERVQLPAVFVIAMGVLNLFWGLFWAFQLVVTILTPAERMHKQTLEQSEAFIRMFPAMKEQLEADLQKKAPEDIKRQSLLMGGSSAFLTLIPALLTIVGGVRMLQLRSFGLCVLASIIAATPCISLPGCCCIGNIVGLWSLVVLIAPEVRQAFR